MFLIIPIGVEYNARRYPVVTFSLIGINIALYLVSLVFFFNNVDGDVEQREWLTFHWGLIPNENVWWTYFTSMFVHAGFFHLLGNMVYLFLFGSCLEDTIGRWQFALFYLVSGLIATGSYMVAASAGHDSGIPMVGASGAISACIGGFLLILAKTKINFRYLIWFFFRLFNGEFWLPAWLVISFWFLSDLFGAFVSYQNPAESSGVAFMAHVGGTLAGIGLIAIWKILPPHFKFAHSEDDEIAEPELAPIDIESNEIASIYLFHDGAQQGPFTSSQVSRMLALGSISADASYWQEGMSEWQTISEFSPL